MVRESLSADARHAMAVMTPGYGFAFQRRTAVAGASTTTGVGGISDEGVRASDGRTLWEVQEGVDLGAASNDGAAGGDDGGSGSKCGSFGLDLMAPLALLWLARRRRNRR